MSGRTCQKWSEQTPHSHDQPALDHNYCRNPDSADGGVWCYTTDPDVEWEYCSQIDGWCYWRDQPNNLHICQSYSSTYPKHWNYEPMSPPSKPANGLDYAGTRTKTKSGLTCQKWSEQYPHKHDRPAWEHNYCRNPDSEDGPWCYTTDPDVRWEYCAISCMLNFFHSNNFKLIQIVRVQKEIVVGTMDV